MGGSAQHGDRFADEHPGGDLGDPGILAHDETGGGVVVAVGEQEALAIGLTDPVRGNGGVGAALDQFALHLVPLDAAHGAADLEHGADAPGDVDVEADEDAGRIEIVEGRVVVLGDEADGLQIAEIGLRERTLDRPEAFDHGGGCCRRGFRRDQVLRERAGSGGQERENRQPRLHDFSGPFRPRTQNHSYRRPTDPHQAACSSRFGPGWQRIIASGRTGSGQSGNGSRSAGDTNHSFTMIAYGLNRVRAYRPTPFCPSGLGYCVAGMAVVNGVGRIDRSVRAVA